MSDKKNKIARFFMLSAGIIFFLSGLIVVMAEDLAKKDVLIDNFAFFLTGGILIYLGLTWKKNK